MGQFSDAEDELNTNERVTHPCDDKITPISDPIVIHKKKSEDHGQYNDRKEYVVEKDVGMDMDQSDEGYDEDEDEDDDDEDEYWDDGPIRNNKENSSATKKQKVTLQPQDKQFSKFVNRIKLDKYEGQPLLQGKVGTHLNESTKKHHIQSSRVKDRKDRATVEQVLDPRTKMILYKLLNKGMIAEINGCVSTGKEANVYHASTASGHDRAVKIFKTSILVFKDRDKYVTGEYRFRHGYCKGNPRKMVKTWAEKEMRNLTRLFTAGIPCPEPHILRSHVLVMDFIGHNGWPAPLLKDANISESKAREVYLQCVRIMRDLHWKAKLVHADLSEFNILYNPWTDRIFIIDVSQSVEHDHPNALMFLRKDCTNINDFFRKRGVAVMTLKELFEFITDPLITDETVDEYISRAQEIAVSRTESELTEADKVNEQVFKNVYIPQRLDEVVDYEDDVKKAKEGNVENLHYANLTGMKTDLSGAKVELELQKVDEGGKNIVDMDNDNSNDCNDTNHDCESRSSDEEDKDSDDDEQEEDIDGEHMTDTIVVDGTNSDKTYKELRKEHKQAVKEENREKRKEKMPKKVKKRKEKVSKGKRK